MLIERQASENIIQEDNTTTETTIQEQNIIHTKHKQYYFNFTVYLSEYNKEKKVIIDKLKVLDMNESYIGEIGILKMEMDTVSVREINHSGFILSDSHKGAEDYMNNFVFELYKNK